jgi:hypothetical protein
MSHLKQIIICILIFTLVACQTKMLVRDSVQQEGRYDIEKYEKHISIFTYEFDSIYLISEKKIVASIYDSLTVPNDISFMRYISNNKTPLLETKEKVSFSFSMDDSNAQSPKESVSFFIDKTLFFNDSCLSREAFESNFYAKNLSKRITHVLKNKPKKDKVELSILLHNANIYCDTIIPLKFKHISIFYTGGEFQLTFSKMVN